MFAGARDPAAQSLKELSAQYPNVHAVKLTSGDKGDNEAAVKFIEAKAGQLDVIIANAGKYTLPHWIKQWCLIRLVGITNYHGPLATTPIREFEDHWRVNTIGPVVLFQAVHKLLLASPTKAPLFAVISAAAGSIAGYIPMSSAAYGSSKAAVNFLVKVLDDEHAKDGLITMAINPGWVATEMVTLVPSSLYNLHERALKYFLNRAITVQFPSV